MLAGVGPVLLTGHQQKCYAPGGLRSKVRLGQDHDGAGEDVVDAASVVVEQGDNKNQGSEDGDAYIEERGHRECLQ